MSEPPKLYVHKPKKAHLKQSKVTMEAQSTTATPSSSSSTGGGYDGGASKPPEVPKQSFVRRYKFFVPLILSVNLAIGAYLFMRTKKKDITVEEETTDAASTLTPTPSTSSATPTTAAVTASLPAAQATRVREPIPEQQQRELFKWMLEEKRKIKTNDPEEKKRIDEEKAILKQFIRAKSIPSI
ncbi:uncharacterized protein LOC110719837 [Chenopodium quinoa]|uniref:uncharacterized protein LOC110719837 n=1 Tax=Chenopodium quinoa TaxID=63459 RepID=UPI000B77A3FC|nr:uncharacterized protein LOC110719837 [Chenopodium quinoa]